MVQIGGESLGPFGATLLSMGAVGAAGMGAFGLLQNNGSPSSSSLTGIAATSPARNTPSTSPSSRSVSPTGSPASQTPGTSPIGSHPKAGSHFATGAVPLGPPLSSQPYASYAVKIYPGQLSPTAQLATTGFKIAVKSSNRGLTVSIGGSVKQTAFFPTAKNLYFIEASLGDDSPPGGEYNMADDGLRATNAQGRIVQ